MTITTTPASTTVGDTAQVLANIDSVDADALLGRVVGALYAAEIVDGAVQLEAGHTTVLADPEEGEVWHGEAVDNADASLQYGLAFVAAAIAAGATI
ncbi:hypothetical protein ASU32_00345 [Tsukamurella tyrosinosolvens]|nr:hypothetical protein ASU32_00345 [Tsukamurella tyrosinosolvens]